MYHTELGAASPLEELVPALKVENLDSVIVVASLRILTITPEDSVDLVHPIEPTVPVPSWDIPMNTGLPVVVMLTERLVTSTAVVLELEKVELELEDCCPKAALLACVTALSSILAVVTARLFILAVVTALEAKLAATIPPVPKLLVGVEYH